MSSKQFNLFVGILDDYGLESFKRPDKSDSELLYYYMRAELNMHRNAYPYIANVPPPLEKKIFTQVKKKDWKKASKLLCTVPLKQITGLGKFTMPKVKLIDGEYRQVGTETFDESLGK